MEHSQREPFRFVVFDWDGTIMDSTAAIVVSLRQAAADCGFAVPSEEACAYIIGLSVFESFKRVMPGVPESEYPRLTERFRARWLENSTKIVLFDGIYELIEELSNKGITLAVATGKSRRGLNRAFDETTLGRFFDASRTSDETFSKPHPAMLLELMDELGYLPHETVMVGDTSHDLLMASNAGVSSVGVTYGAHDEKELLAHSPLKMARTVRELSDWLHRYTK